MCAPAELRQQDNWEKEKTDCVKITIEESTTHNRHDTIENEIPSITNRFQLKALKKGRSRLVTCYASIQLMAWH